jgi:TatD DNase family protein
MAWHGIEPRTVATHLRHFYDTHSHMDFPDFAGDLPYVIQRAREADITRINCGDTDLDGSRRAVALAESNEGLFAVIGWHPGHATETLKLEPYQIMVLVTSRPSS